MAKVGEPLHLKDRSSITVDIPSNTQVINDDYQDVELEEEEETDTKENLILFDNNYIFTSSMIEAIKKFYPIGTKFLKVNGSTIQNHTATLRLKTKTKDEFLSWLKTHQLLSGVTFRVQRSKNVNGKVVLFKASFRCQHNTVPSRTRTPSKKHTDCQSQMYVTIKTSPTDRVVRTKDTLRKEYPTIVRVKHLHNHSIDDEQALRYKDPRDEVKSRYTELLRMHQSPVIALKAYKKELRTKYQNNFKKVVTDRSICPDAKWVYAFYSKIRKKSNFNEEHDEKDNDNDGHDDNDDANHLIYDVQVLKSWNPEEEIENRFMNLFEVYQSPAEALDAFREDLHEKYQDDFIKVASNTSICPDAKWVYDLYKKHRDKFSEDNELKIKMEDYSETERDKERKESINSPPEYLKTTIDLEVIDDALISSMEYEPAEQTHHSQEEGEDVIAKVEKEIEETINLLKKRIESNPLLYSEAMASFRSSLLSMENDPSLLISALRQFGKTDPSPLKLEKYLVPIPRRPNDVGKRKIGRKKR